MGEVQRIKNVLGLNRMQGLSRVLWYLVSRLKGPSGDGGPPWQSDDNGCSGPLFALGSRQSLAARLPTRPQRQHQALKVYWWPSISLRGWEAGYYGKEINFRGIARGGEGWKRNGNKWKSEGGDLVVFVGLEPNPTATQRAITGFKRVIISSTKEEEDCGPKSLSNLSCGMGLSKTTLNGQLGSGVDEI